MEHYSRHGPFPFPMLESEAKKSNFWRKSMRQDAFVEAERWPTPCIRTDRDMVNISCWDAALGLSNAAVLTATSWRWVRKSRNWLQNGFLLPNPGIWRWVFWGLGVVRQLQWTNMYQIPSAIFTTVYQDCLIHTTTPNLLLLPSRRASIPDAIIIFPFKSLIILSFFLNLFY